MSHEKIPRGPEVLGKKKRGMDEILEYLGIE